MSSRRSRSKPKAAPAVDHSAFWGQADKIPDVDVRVNPAADPTVVIRSLTKPPFIFNNENSERHFSLVYTRATMLAHALAAASGLLDPNVGTFENDD